MEYPEVAKALNKAKIALLSKTDSTFFSSICFSLKQEISEAVPTAATDSETIWYNPNFFMSLSETERVFLLVHEAMHVALLHIHRRGDRNPKKWNMAADYVINLMLVDRGFDMPEGGLLDNKYRDMDTVQVYDLLPDNPTSDCPMLDVMEPGESGGGTAESLEADEQRIQDILVRAATQSAMAGDSPGSIPGSIRIYLEKLLNPKLPFETLLRRFMKSLNKDDYSWRRPNKRFVPKFYLPTMRSESMGHISISVDASGSVTDKEFLRFVSEIHNVIKQIKPKKLTLIVFDHGIRSIHEINSCMELLQVEFTGRGGTNITEVIEWTAKNKPDVAIMFTDGYFQINCPDLKTPFLWLIHQKRDFSAPFGKIIQYEV